MKKFTLLHGNDDDSANSFNSIQAVNELGHSSQDLPRITKITIILVEINKQSTLEVIGDSLISHIKSKLLENFGSLLPDGLNMGLYLPGDGNKMGKYLEEDRLLSEYTGYRFKLLLQFRKKKRIHAQKASFNDEKSAKDIQKSFLRYVTRGDHKKVGLLLDKGFDPNFQCCKTGETPLTKAVARAKPHTMIGTLIAGGAHCSYYSKSGLTPLHKASVESNYEAVKSLLDFGQSPNTRCRKGLTPLYHNILHDQNTKICHSLLYEHSELGVYNEDGLQEIHQAARLNRTEQINLLIMYGADVNSRCQMLSGTQRTNSLRSSICSYDTPLHVAASFGQREAVIRLLSWGADPKLINDARQTPIEVALKNGFSELADLMRLFRGSNKPDGMGEPFLPTPTYNPKRRMRHAPSNSYVTEPTSLIDYCSEDESAKETNQAELPNNQVFSRTSTSVQRTLSMINLQLPTSSSPPDPIEHTGKPSNLTGSFFLSTQAYYDLLRDSMPPVGATLGRRPKSTKEPLRPPPVLPLHRLPYPSKKSTGNWNSKGTNLETPGINAFTSKFHTQGCGESADDLGSADRYTDCIGSADHFSGKSAVRFNGNFQREGSQTDSGISNSSNEKPQLPEQKLVKPTKLKLTKPTESQTLGTPITPQGAQTIYPIRPNTLKHSFSVHDDRLWRLSSASGSGHETFRSTNNNLANGDSNTPSSIKSSRTVLLTRLGGQSSGTTYGLSLRTSKDPSIVANFRPTPERPSLQTATRIIPNMPAYNAGIQEGDYILKINDIDVTGSSHDEVCKYLCRNNLNTVSLTVISPMRHPPAPKPPTVSPLFRNDAPTEMSTSSSSATYYSFPVDNSRDHQNHPSFSRANRQPPDCSAPSSARSSDRTNCSSLPDEGIWSPSNGMSSREASGRSSLVTCWEDNKSQGVINRPHSGGSAVDRTKESIDQTRIVRSRTTSGISECRNPDGNTQHVAQSLYFARNPRFHRLGSQDSRSSASSGGLTNGVHRNPVPQYTNEQIPTVHRKPAQSRVARHHKVALKSTNQKLHDNAIDRLPIRLSTIKSIDHRSRDFMKNANTAASYSYRTPSLGHVEYNRSSEDHVIQPPAEFC